MAWRRPDRISEGASAIIEATDRNDERPLWISVWGGTDTLAQALIRVRASRSPNEVARFVANLRFYSISDQDVAGSRIRREFPNLFYIVAPSTPTGGKYYYATWTGISGDKYYRRHKRMAPIQYPNEGPIGQLYPPFLFITEGEWTRRNGTHIPEHQSGRARDATCLAQSRS
jgi:hypothetical protein